MTRYLIATCAGVIIASLLFAFALARTAARADEAMHNFFDEED